MKYELKNKAYKFNEDKVFESWDFVDLVVFAENINQARTRILKEYSFIQDSAKLLNGDEITYLNIPVIRSKEYDQYFFEDKLLNLSQIEEILSKNKRIEELDKILNDDSIKYVHIMKYGDYYGHKSQGYVPYERIADIGVFDKVSAIREAKSVDTLKIVPINISEYNQKLDNLINKLTKLKINEDSSN